jgi:hypothetical protein
VVFVGGCGRWILWNYLYVNSAIVELLSCVGKNTTGSLQVCGKAERITFVNKLFSVQLSM